MLGAYLLYLFALLVLTFSKIRALSVPFRFLFSITLAVYFVVFVGLFAGYFYSIAVSATIFLSFYAIINLYIWTLTFAFCPVGTDEE
jgi:hypothetical protein